MIAPEVAIKCCRECREEQPASAFLPSKFTGDKLTDRCRRCVFRAAQRDRQNREARRTLAGSGKVAINADVRARARGRSRSKAQSLRDVKRPQPAVPASPNRRGLDNAEL